MKYDPTDIRGNEAADQARKDKERLQAELQADDFKSVLSTPQGRRLIWRLLDKCGVYRSTFRPNSEAAFLEGQRAIGLYLLLDLQDLCPDRLVEMLAEAKERAKSK